MKILLGSHPFSPQIGGIERCSLDLAKAFEKRGHTVQIVTQSLSDNPAKDDHGLNVLRSPSPIKLIKAVNSCDVFFQNNISLKTIWPALLLRKPLHVTTQTWLGRSQNAPGVVGAMKRMALRFANNYYISTAIASNVGYPGELIGNPYDERSFRRISNIQKVRDVVFLGRLVPDKGADLLIEALKELHLRKQPISATIIGDGPERMNLERITVNSGLEDHIVFLGKLEGDRLVEELNAHKVIAIPSIWNEPFGIVALEGMACGCVPVVSSGGGLPEATGIHGITFENGSKSSLVEALSNALETSVSLLEFEKHLSNFQIDNIAERYCNYFRKRNKA